jgi:hypothetical protein
LPAWNAPGGWRLRTVSVTASTIGEPSRRRGIVPPRRRLLLASLALSLVLAACGTKQTLEQAVQCDAFTRAPDGTWSTSKDVSLNYLRDGVEHQLNMDKGLSVTGKVAGMEPQLAATLERKCVPKP